MFIVLEIKSPKKRGFFARRRYKRQGMPPEICKMETPYTYYYRFGAELNKEGVNWDTVYSLSGRLCGQMLFTDDTLRFGHLPPENSGISRFDGRDYRTELLKNAFLKYISNELSENCPIALIDIDAKNLLLAEKMLKMMRQVYVITAEPSKYQAFNEQASKSIGAEVIISDTVRIAEQCAAVIAPAGLDRAGSVTVPDIMFAPDTCGAYDVPLSSVPVAPDIARWRPDGISGELFQSALYSFSGKKEFGGLLPVNVSKHGRIITIKDTACSI